MSFCPRIQAVAFDLDGTLVDSVAAITASVNWLFGRLKKKPLTRAQVAQAVGEGARTLFNRLMVGDPRQHDDQLFHDFITHYTRTSPSRTPFFPHAQKALWDVKNRVPVVLLTNKPRDATRGLLRVLGVADWFTLVLCPEDVRHRKPHPESLLVAAASLGVPPQHLLMTGDGRPDALCAYMAGTPLLACTFGYGGQGFYQPFSPAGNLKNWREFPYGWLG